MNYVAQKTLLIPNLRLDPAFRKLLRFGILGLVIAGALVVGVELRPANIIPVNGTLVVEIVDAPLAELASSTACGDCSVSSLNVTIDSVQVHREGALNLDGEWMEVLHDTTTIDIVQLKNMTEILGSATIPESMISSVRLHVSSASAKLSGSGTLVTLIIPSDELRIPLQSLVKVKGGLTTTMVIDFQPHVVCQGNGQCRLTPILVLKNIKGPE